MKLTIIAAIGKNNELGKNNDLIWHIKEDLTFFKAITEFNYIVMGRKTLESLPKKLKNRKYIVISRTLKSCEDYIVYNSIDDFLNNFTPEKNRSVYIIGGASIYKEMLPYTTNMLITHINSESECDEYFPEIPVPLFKGIEIGKYYDEKNNFTYTRKFYIQKEEDWTSFF